MRMTKYENIKENYSKSESYAFKGRALCDVKANFEYLFSIIEHMKEAGLNIQHMLVPESKEAEKLIDIFLKLLEE